MRGGRKRRFDCSHTGICHTEMTVEKEIQGGRGRKNEDKIARIQYVLLCSNLLLLCYYKLLQLVLYAYDNIQMLTT